MQTFTTKIGTRLFRSEIDSGKQWSRQTSFLGFVWPKTAAEIADNFPSKSLPFKSFCTRGVNWASRERAAPNHTSTMINKMAPKYGVEVAKEPKPKIRNCWMRAPPDFPSGLQTTSIAAFPLSCKWNQNPWSVNYWYCNGTFPEVRACSSSNKNRCHTTLLIIPKH